MAEDLRKFHRGILQSLHPRICTPPYNRCLVVCLRVSLLPCAFGALANRRCASVCVLFVMAKAIPVMQSLLLRALGPSSLANAAYARRMPLNVRSELRR